MGNLTLNELGHFHILCVGQWKFDHAEESTLHRSCGPVAKVGLLISTPQYEGLSHLKFSCDLTYLWFVVGIYIMKNFDVKNVKIETD